jgi:hypothetical protein
VPNRVISKNQPSISLEQASIVIIDEDIVATLRIPNFKLGEDCSRFRLATGSPDQDPLVNDCSLLSSAYNDIREQMKHKSPYLKHIFEGSSACDLAVVIVDCILTQNYRFYDSLNDWYTAIIDAIQQGVGSRQTSHIASFFAMLKFVCKNIRPLQRALDPERWSVEPIGSHQLDVDDEDFTFTAETRVRKSLAAGRIGKIKSMSVSLSLNNLRGSRVTRKTLGQRPHLKSSRSDSMQPNSQSLRHTASLGSNAVEPNCLQRFFEEQLEEFREMSLNLRTLARSMDDKKFEVERVASLIDAKRDDMMNTTLYVLKVLTTLSIIPTFLTGVWGMNFSDMYELYPHGTDPTAIGKPNYVEPNVPIVGYKLFWIVLGLTEFLIIFYTLRTHVFDIL